MLGICLVIFKHLFHKFMYFFIQKSELASLTTNLLTSVRIQVCQSVCSPLTCSTCAPSLPGGPLIGHWGSFGNESRGDPDTALALCRVNGLSLTTGSEGKRVRDEHCRHARLYCMLPTLPYLALPFSIHY